MAFISTESCWDRKKKGQGLGSRGGEHRPASDPGSLTGGSPALQSPAFHRQHSTRPSLGPEALRRWVLGTLLVYLLFTTTIWIQIIPPIAKGCKWGLDILSHMPKDTPVVKSRTRTQTQTCVASKSGFLPSPLPRNCFWNSFQNWGLPGSPPPVLGSPLRGSWIEQWFLSP